MQALQLVPALPPNLLSLLVQNMPHKMRDRDTQCLYLRAAFALAESPAGAPIREGLLVGVVEHLLTVDVEIRWEAIVEVPTGAHARCSSSSSTRQAASLRGWRCRSCSRRSQLALPQLQPTDRSWRCRSCSRRIAAGAAAAAADGRSWRCCSRSRRIAAGAAAVAAAAAAGDCGWCCCSGSCAAACVELQSDVCVHCRHSWRLGI